MSKHHYPSSDFKFLKLIVSPLIFRHAFPSKDSSFRGMSQKKMNSKDGLVVHSFYSLQLLEEIVSGAGGLGLRPEEQHYHEILQWGTLKSFPFSFLFT